MFEDIKINAVRLDNEGDLIGIDFDVEKFHELHGYDTEALSKFIKHVSEKVKKNV